MATANQTRSTFRQSCSVCCEIRATPEKIWGLLTDAARFAAWNSTVTSLDGPIALGHKLALKVALDPKRTFKPRVTRLDAPNAMVWSDGFAPMFRGVRTFEVTAKGAVTEFVMTEVLSGAMLPMIRGSLPDFGPAFERFAEDLKAAAER